MSTHEKIHKYGHLTIIFGPMFAGKSSELIRLVTNYHIMNRNVTIITSQKENDRYPGENITTHRGDKIKAVRYSTLREAEVEISENLKNSEVLAIDEAQFFPDLARFVKHWLSENKTIIVSGLIADFNGNKFGNILDIMPWQDKVIPVYALCTGCNIGMDAAHSCLITNNNENPKNNDKTKNNEKNKESNNNNEKNKESNNIVIGGADKYKSLCRRCMKGIN